MNSEEYVNKILKIKGLDSDYKLNKLMGWPTNRTTRYRDGQSMDNEAARQVAEILEIPVMKVIADMESQRFERQGKKEKALAWDKLSKMAGNIELKLLFSLPFLSFLVLYTIYYVKLAFKYKGGKSTVSTHFA